MLEKRFLCKCSKLYNNFNDWIKHIKNKHKCFTDIDKIILKYNNKVISIKFYWSLNCKCGNNFSSSLCNSDMEIKNNKIINKKIYNLKCIKCNKNANFDDIKELKEYLNDKIRQKLIIWYNNNIFKKYDNKNEDLNKILKGHKQKLCEKCNKLGKYCGNESISNIIPKNNIVIEIHKKEYIFKPENDKIFYNRDILLNIYNVIHSKNRNTIIILFIESIRKIKNNINFIT